MANVARPGIECIDLGAGSFVHRCRREGALQSITVSGANTDNPTLGRIIARNPTARRSFLKARFVSSGRSKEKPPGAAAASSAGIKRGAHRGGWEFTYPKDTAGPK